MEILTLMPNPMLPVRRMGAFGYRIETELTFSLSMRKG